MLQLDQAKCTAWAISRFGFRRGGQLSNTCSGSRQAELALQHAENNPTLLTRTAWLAKGTWNVLVCLTLGSQIMLERVFPRTPSLLGQLESTLRLLACEAVLHLAASTGPHVTRGFVTTFQSNVGIVGASCIGDGFSGLQVNMLLTDNKCVPALLATKAFDYLSHKLSGDEDMLVS